MSICIKEESLFLSRLQPLLIQHESFVFLALLRYYNNNRSISAVTAVSDGIKRIYLVQLDSYMDSKFENIFA